MFVMSYCPICSFDFPNPWMNVFHLLSYLQVNRIQPLGTQTASNIDERMVRIRAFHRNRIPTCAVSQDAKFPLSTFNGATTKWKRVKTTATWRRSGRPCKITEQDVTRIVHMLAKPVAMHLQTLCRIQMKKFWESVLWNIFYWLNSYNQA